MESVLPQRKIHAETTAGDSYKASAAATIRPQGALKFPIRPGDDFDPDYMESTECLPPPDEDLTRVGKVARVDSPAYCWRDQAGLPQSIPAKVVTYGAPGSGIIDGIAIEFPSLSSRQEVER